MEARMEARMHLATNLRRLRKERCWSQELLAHFAGLHPTEVSRLERGLREPRLRTVVQVAAALKVPVQELIMPPEPAPEPEPVP
jgi:transcriptional regulator with XRE-family HTH domain